MLCGTAVTVLLVERIGLQSLALGWAVTQIMVSVGALIRLRVQFPEAIPHSIPRLSLAVLRKRLSQGAWISISQIAVVLLNATDAVIIGNVLGPAAVVPYACTIKLIQFLGNQPQLLLQSAQPGLAELRASASGTRVFEAATALTQAVLILMGAIACGVMAVNYGFVRLWVGQEQWGGFTLSALVILRTLLAQWNLTTAVAIFAFGYERRLALVGIADGLVFVGLATWLVRRLGISGAPLAGVITVSLLSLPFNLAALSRETGTTVLGLLRQLGPWAWRFVLGFGCAALVARAWKPVTLLELAVVGTVAVAIYGTLTIHQLLKPPFSRYLHPALLTRLQRLPGLSRDPVIP